MDRHMFRYWLCEPHIGLGLGVLLVLSLIITNAQALEGKANPPSTPKVSIVFDASVSMCGYLRGDLASEKNKMVQFVKTAHEMRQMSDAQVYFLAQKQVGTGDPKKDLHPVGSNLYSAILQVAERKDSHCVPSDKDKCLIPSGPGDEGRCSVFPGVDSSMNLIFSEKAPTNDSDTIVLVTDALFNNKTRETFVNDYATWINRTRGSGVSISDMSAGYAIREARFLGEYFSEVDTGAKYELGDHDRPLVVMWFSRNPNHLPLIKKILGVSHAVAGGGQEAGEVSHTLLPVLDNKGNHLKFPASIKDLLALDVKPSGAYGRKNIPDTATQDCFRLDASEGNVVTIRASASCNSRGLFKDISSYTATLKPRMLGAVKVELTENGIKSNGISMEISTSKANSVRQFNVQFSSDDSVSDVEAWSAESDDCRNLSAGVDAKANKSGTARKAARMSTPFPSRIDSVACTEHLKRKTYNLAILSKVMRARSLRIMMDELQGITNHNYTLKTVVEQTARK